MNSTSYINNGVARANNPEVRVRAGGSVDAVRLIHCKHIPAVVPDPGG